MGDLRFEGRSDRQLFYHKWQSTIVAGDLGAPLEMTGKRDLMFETNQPTDFYPLTSIFY